MENLNVLQIQLWFINELLKNKPIPYYYILVNTKNSFKLFETERGDIYKNPREGLLVYEGITNPDFFEFYIQPQFVNQGSATPTLYQVAYGNLNCPDIVPRFTNALCYLYANWQGPIRVPNVLKNAEKIAKELKDKYVTIEHYFIALAENSNEEDIKKLLNIS